MEKKIPVGFFFGGGGGGEGNSKSCRLEIKKKKYVNTWYMKDVRKAQY